VSLLDTLGKPVYGTMTDEKGGFLLKYAKARALHTELQLYGLPIPETKRDTCRAVKPMWVLCY
jgi:hypothetical protein